MLDVYLYKLKSKPCKVLGLKIKNMDFSDNHAGSIRVTRFKHKIGIPMDMGDHPLTVQPTFGGT